MAGITRIKIIGTKSGRGRQRFIDSEAHWNTANDLYREIFERVGMSLEEGSTVVECTQDEFMAGYDYQLGIDIILKFQSGQEMTLQEKFLFTTYDTVTVEHYQNWKTEEPGDWFKMQCQYYFVGYDYKYDQFNPRLKSKFDNWILLNWPSVIQLTARDRIHWYFNKNKYDGARASFRYAYFKDIPDDAIVDKKRATVQLGLFNGGN